MNTPQELISLSTEEKRTMDVKKSIDFLFHKGVVNNRMTTSGGTLINDFAEEHPDHLLYFDKEDITIAIAYMESFGWSAKYTFNHAGLYPQQCFDLKPKQ